MLQKIRNRKGFTLVELMIVVAIIGILAAIAIPNFLKFQAKSKTSEAKTNLKAIYVTETGYFGENNTFGDFSTVKWVPVGKSLIYAYSVSGDPPAAAGTSNPLTSTATTYSSTTGVTGTMVFTGTGLGTPVFDNTHFIAGAAANVSAGVTIPDCWAINDNNILLNTQNGI